MKKMTKEVFASFEKKYVKLVADDGRLAAFFDGDEMVMSWIDVNSFKFVPIAEYDKFELDNIGNKYVDDWFEKKTAGMSFDEALEMVVESASDYDKHVIASLNNRIA
ncbi:MAG: hypothetical protein J6N15_00165 [Ruminiclostridium sp.]|nr:hypothetical protein [Ruminiclostridium sp.]